VATVEIRRAEVCKIVLQITELGNPNSAKVVVLVPGIISTHDYWRDVITEVGQEARVVSMDLMGFGASYGSLADDYSVQSHVAAVVEAIESVKLEDGYTLVGHSFGAMIVLELAAQNPGKYCRVIASGLPLIDPITGPKELSLIARCPEAIVQGPAGWINAIGVWLTAPLVRLFVHKLFKDMPEHVIKDTTRFRPWALMRSLQTMMNYDPSGSLQTNKHKTTLLFGGMDSITSEVVAKLGTLPGNYVLKFLDCDHQIPLRMPADYTKVVLSRSRRV
jgi:pimeloyl-ACP methyl ester carboxylesterase